MDFEYATGKNAITEEFDLGERTFVMVGKPKRTQASHARE